MTGEEYGDLFREACDLFENNEYDKAEEICNRLIEVNDKQAPIFNLLALIKDKKGELDLAIKNSEIAVFLKKDDYIYYSNLGNFLRKKGELSKALYILEKSVELNPNFHISNFNLGNVHRVLKNNGEAQKYFEKAIELKLDYVEALNNLGLLYMENNYPSLSVKYYRKALEFASNDPEILLNLAISLLAICDYEEVELVTKKIISILPDYYEPYKYLSDALIYLSRPEEAKEYLKKHLSLSPYHLSEILSTIYEIRINILTKFFYNDNYEIESYRNTLISLYNKIPQITDITFLINASDINLSICPFCIYDGEDNKDLKVMWANIFEKCVIHGELNTNQGKIKIGFLVTKNNEGLFVKFLGKIINSLNTQEFEVYIICDEIGWSRKIKNNLEGDINTVFIPLSIFELSKKVYDLHLDILYYWEIGTDSTNYFLSFFRLAPIQCTSIGWPDTTGIKTIDYFISSELIEIETAQEHYSEKLIKLKKLPLYCPKIILENLESQHFFNLGNYNIYLCGQYLRKLHPDFDYIIYNILEKDKNALFIIIESDNKSFSKLFLERIKSHYRNIDFSRIKVLEQLSYQRYLSLIKYSHICLDTLYFGGANSTYDCFAMETPVVTYPWTHERGRYTLGCYKQMGIEGLVANSLDEYVNLAIKTANDKEFRDKIVRDIRKNNHKLFQNKEIIDEYIQLFKNLVKEKRKV